ncbi:MAG: hypothetical protein NZ700_11990 [Gemmataceae bacterium]|nr:hypothetical protein [Gemmataceae bacterium]MDW8266625.1 hypothetical protein [Gemmataceae bacterium]
MRVSRVVWLTFLASSAWALAAQPDPIAQSIERGVAGLKKLQNDDGSFRRPEVGATALAALTLLECGVPADDPSVKKAVAVVRQAIPALTHTYSVALAIMCLDRLGDPADVSLIQSLGVRLLGGQNAAGGWTYTCPAASEAEQRRLRDLLRSLASSPGAADQPSKPAGPAAARPELPDTLRKEVEAILRPNAPAGRQDGFLAGIDDNSNTQFATLGLWIARRYGVPTEQAFRRLDDRFRKSQQVDGGWGYNHSTTRLPVSNSTASMTCAGLLGLAFGHGSAIETTLRTDKGRGAPGGALPGRDPARDPVVRAGLLALATTIGQPSGKPGAQTGLKASVLRRGYYFLWSLERVAVAYGLETIGHKDWYAWGSEILLATQDQETGLWDGENGADVDTCFALLFLKRANLARDLTAALKGRVQDPGTVTLKSGGVGGDMLISKGIKSGIETAPRPGPPPAAQDGDLDAATARLRDQLLKAPRDQQERLLDQFRDSKGVAYTDALATAIPLLPADVQAKARAALADRLSRMTAATLRDKLQEDHPEIRRAAALACAMKDDKSHVPDLIPLLDDPRPLVVRAARAALKSLTAQDFGPGPDSSPAERAKAVAAWKQWWSQQPK